MFGAGEVNQTTLIAAGSLGSSDIFVAKYNSDGTLAWLKSAGGVISDIGSGIAVDSSGNSYVTGVFGGTATFGAGEANQSTLIEAGDLGDTFVAKYSSDGSLVWAKSAGGRISDRGNGIAVDSSGNSYVTGFFGGTATFGAGEANQTTLIDGGIFVAKYNGDGTLLWAKSDGDRNSDTSRGIAVDSTRSIYVTGSFADTATFDAGGVNQTTLSSNGGNDIFVAKFEGEAGDNSTNP